MTQLYAQPYDLSATGFYFETCEEYAVKSAALRNDYGEPVEEFEIQFIDGDEIDYDLAGALGLNQINFAQFLSAVDNWDDREKRTVIIAVGECGYTFGPDLNPSQFEIDIYEIASMCQRRTKTAPSAGVIVHHWADFGRSKSAPLCGM